MSVGRRPVTKGFGLENPNLEKTERGAVKVDEKLQTSVPAVYVCGDLTLSLIHIYLRMKRGLP